MNSFEKYVGQIFDDRYKIIKIIGVGGMAVVFEAFDTKMNKIVAVKMLKDEISDDSQSVKRFINESKAVAMLSHPNIVKIFDVSVKDNLKYIVMECVDGITLKSYMNQKGKLSVKESISYSEQILQALEHAHSKGIIHRDIKPQNIMLLKNGKVKVTDFGIAKLPNAETVTMTDKAIGTVYYISPEQASGKPIDRRSDLYSLGVMMYEMLTGALPFDADSPVSVALMQISERPKPPRAISPIIPRGLEQIILLAMEKDPNSRFQSAEQMLSHLVQIKNNPSYVFKTKKAAPAANTRSSSQAPHNDTAKPTERSAVNPVTETGKIKDSDSNANAPKKQKRYTMFPIVLGVFAAILLVVFLSILRIIKPLLERPEKPKSVDVEVPALVGQVLTKEKETELEAMGFIIRRESNPESISGTPNTILEQSPAAGEVRKVIVGKQPAEITLTLSLGEKAVKLPDYTSKDYRVAADALKAKGLNCKIKREFHDNTDPNCVISTDPAPGTPVPTGSTITVHVSNGPKLKSVEMPSIIGMTEEQANEALSAQGLRIGEIKYEKSDKPEGTIVWQSIEAYSSVDANTTIVDITISGSKDNNTF